MKSNRPTIYLDNVIHLARIRLLDILLIFKTYK